MFFFCMHNDERCNLIYLHEFVVDVAQCKMNGMPVDTHRTRYYCTFVV